MVRYLAARTAFFDRVVTAALERGVTQVVVAAAGYDGRALRYAKPGVRWFEVDHPDTQRDKRERLDPLGVGAEHIALVAAHFNVDDGAAATPPPRPHAPSPSVITRGGVGGVLGPSVPAAVPRQ